MKLFRITFAFIFLAAAFTVFAGPADAFMIRGTEYSEFSNIYKVDGKEFVALDSVCRAYGLKREWDDSREAVTLSKDNKKAVFKIGSEEYWTAGRSKYLKEPIQLHGGILVCSIYFSKKEVQRIFDIPRYATTPKRKTTSKVDIPVIPPLERRYHVRTIILDPGHGGKDPGAVGRRGLKEKDVVLDIALILRDILRKKGIRVIMTREDDRFISLWRRAKIANDASADLFVSIHANAARQRYTRGFEAYYLSEATDNKARALAAAENAVVQYENGFTAENSKNPIVWDLILHENRQESIELAEWITRVATQKLGLRNRGVKSARFYVLKGCTMPAVLLEVGFISNLTEESNFKSSFYRKKLAEVISKGLLAYKDIYDKTGGFSN